MVFTSTHLSLMSSLSSTQGLNPFKPLLNQVESSSVAGSPIKLQTSIKNLGVYLDSRLSFDKQLSITCKASYFHIRALCHIRSSLTTEAAKTSDPGLIIALNCSPRWHIFLPSGPPPACSEYPCTRCGPKVSLWSYHACFVWIALASCSSQNKFQDSCHHSHGPAVSAALLPRCTHSTLCACAITPLLIILVNMCSSAQNLHGSL